MKNTEDKKIKIKDKQLQKKVEYIYEEVKRLRKLEKFTFNITIVNLLNYENNR